MKLPLILPQKIGTWNNLAVRGQPADLTLQHQFDDINSSEFKERQDE
jgi:hypothetical protein